MQLTKEQGTVSTQSMQGKVGNRTMPFDALELLLNSFSGVVTVKKTNARRFTPLSSAVRATPTATANVQPSIRVHTMLSSTVRATPASSMGEKVLCFSSLDLVEAVPSGKILRSWVC